MSRYWPRTLRSASSKRARSDIGWPTATVRYVSGPACRRAHRASVDEVALVTRYCAGVDPLWWTQGFGFMQLGSPRERGRLGVSSGCRTSRCSRRPRRAARFVTTSRSRWWIQASSRLRLAPRTLPSRRCRTRRRSIRTTRRARSARDGSRTAATCRPTPVAVMHDFIVGLTPLVHPANGSGRGNPALHWGAGAGDFR